MLYVKELFEGHTAVVADSETGESLKLTGIRLRKLAMHNEVVGIQLKSNGDFEELQEFDCMTVDTDFVEPLKPDYVIHNGEKSVLFFRKKSEINAAYSSSRNTFYVKTYLGNVKKYLADPKHRVGRYTSERRWAKVFSTYNEAKGTAMNMSSHGNKEISWKVE